MLKDLKVIYHGVCNLLPNGSEEKLYNINLSLRIWVGLVPGAPVDAKIDAQVLI
jgi:hypothetical protein